MHLVKSTGERNSFSNLTKYVRVTKEDQRFVEFNFAIDDPSLFVELVLPKQAFNAFCETNRVIFMSAEQEAAVDGEMEKWRYGDETLMSRNHRR